MKLDNYKCEGQLSIFDYLKAADPEPRQLKSEQSEEPSRQQDTQDEYLKENPTCFYVFGHYLDRADGWHKVPEELPMFTPWQKVDVVVFGKKTGTAWMELGAWEAKDWTFRTIDEAKYSESIEVLAWKLSD